MTPVGLSFYEELEEYFCAQEEFEFFACCCADLFYGFPALADQNSLLAFAFYVDGGADAQKFGRFLEIVDEDGDGVGDFVARLQDGFFADDFGGLTFPDAETLAGLLRTAGFAEVAFRLLAGSIIAVHTGIAE